MTYTLKFTPKAEETFELLILQLRDRWGEKFVLKFEDKVTKTISAISQTPYLYPVSYENRQLRKCVLHKNCSMFYGIYDNVVLIAYFWDNRQEPLF